MEMDSNQIPKVNVVVNADLIPEFYTFSHQHPKSIFTDFC